MAILCCGWGTVTTCIAATLVAARFMLGRFCPLRLLVQQHWPQNVQKTDSQGIPEAGFFPGAILMASYWYPRYMLQTRIALFYTSSATAGAFSGFLAFAIAKMDGLGGIAGWRYIFLIVKSSFPLLY